MIKKSDWVTTANGGRGIVTSVAKDGSTAMVNWGQWKKRMSVEHLTILHTIPLGSGWAVTDMTREVELEADIKN